MDITHAALLFTDYITIHLLMYVLTSDSQRLQAQEVVSVVAKSVKFNLCLCPLVAKWKSNNKNAQWPYKWQTNCGHIQMDKEMTSSREDERNRQYTLLLNVISDALKVI